MVMAQGLCTGLPVIRRLDALAGLVRRRGEVYVRWSRGPEHDLPKSRTTDGLSGIDMPGLSVNPLHPPPWWPGHDVELWVARKLHEYSPLAGRLEDDGSRKRAWVAAGDVAGRGPDNEPLLRPCAPVALIDDAVLAEAASVVDAFMTGEKAPRQPDQAGGEDDPAETGNA
jgi:hypothetical protein